MKEQKIKTLIRRILSFPIFLVLSPIIWVFTDDTYKEMWESLMEITEYGIQMGVV